MIRKISITNFRSIKKDIVELPNKVTAVIGPNGTGKTNLFLAFRFVSNCLQESPVRAVQKAGGLDKVFSVRERRAQKCSFEIEFDHTAIAGAEKNGITSGWKIQYFFELKYDEKVKVLVVAKERLIAENHHSSQRRIFFQRTSTVNKSSIIGELVPEDDQKMNERIQGFIYPSALALPVVSEDYLFGSVRVPIRQVARSVADILRGVSGYNLDPQALRRSSDLLTRGDLNFDGRGFPAFFHRISTAGKNPVFSANGRWIRVEKESLMNRMRNSYEDILPFIKLISAEEAIDTTSVQMRFTEKHQAGERTFRPEHLSDGTLKFLALSLLIILPSYSILFIEEIENYLNPKAIKRLIDLMKEAGDDGAKIIMTTHSETVLNQMSPMEVLISTRSTTGETKYRKFLEAEEITHALDDSGASLGTYWAKGGLDAF